MNSSELGETRSALEDFTQPNVMIRRSERHADVIVIGAGVLGTFHAYFVAQKGYKTFLLERNALPQDASTRNFGMIVHTIVETGGEWAEFARDSREIYLSIQQNEHDIAVKRHGSLYVASTEIEDRVLQEFARSYGQAYGCTYLTGEEAGYRYPFVQTAYCRGALLFPNDLSAEPHKLLRQFIPYLAQTERVKYFPYTMAIAVEPYGQGCRVRDAAGNVFMAERVFVCSGAEYRTLFPERFKESGLRVCKLQMMQTFPQERVLPHSLLSGLSIERYPAFRSCPSYSLLHEQTREEELRRYGIHLLFKQAEDGAVIIGDSHEYRGLYEEGAAEETTDTLINEAILNYGRKMIRLPDWNIQRMWNGYYLLHPQRPVYTETIAERIHIVTGIAGKGMSTGPGFVRRHVEATLA